MQTIYVVRVRPGALVLTLLTLAVVWAASGAPAPATGPGPVVIDPGHGGIDGGAGRGDLLEKHITLDVALRLQRHLQQRGVTVVLTRETDTDLGGSAAVRGRHRRDLAARVGIVRRHRAAALVSLHVNAAADSRRRGPLIFFKQHSPASRTLAELIDEQLAALYGYTAGAPLPARYFILREATVPAVLVEMGFASNPEDRRRLQDAAHREELAARVATAVAAYAQGWLTVPPDHPAPRPEPPRILPLW